MRDEKHPYLELTLTETERPTVPTHGAQAPPNTRRPTRFIRAPRPTSRASATRKSAGRTSGVGTSGLQKHFRAGNADRIGILIESYNERKTKWMVGVCAS